MVIPKPWFHIVEIRRQPLSSSAAKIGSICMFPVAAADEVQLQQVFCVAFRRVMLLDVGECSID
jgi:hypothetical protein